MSLVQSILFDKKYWTISGSKLWLVKKNYKYGKVDSTGKYWRYRQMNPTLFKRFRIKEIQKGIKFIFGFRK